jgi:hypothetical protein
MTMPHDALGHASRRACTDDACAGGTVAVRVAVSWFIAADDLMAGMVPEQRASA